MMLKVEMMRKYLQSLKITMTCLNIDNLDGPTDLEGDGFQEVELVRSCSNILQTPVLLFSNTTVSIFVKTLHRIAPVCHQSTNHHQSTTHRHQSTNHQSTTTRRQQDQHRVASVHGGCFHLKNWNYTAANAKD